MKKSIICTLGLAAIAALFCVFCGDNSLDGTAGGEVDALLSKFYNNETPGSGGGGGDGTSLVLGNGQAWTSGNSGFIFTSNNRVFEIYKVGDSWWYADTGIYQTNGDIITINSIAGTYRISGDVLLLSGYTYTFAKTSGISLKTGKASFTDSRDGRSYNAIRINRQIWMAENLNYDANDSKCYDNSTDNCAKYGRLYNWATAMDIDTSYNTTRWNGSDVNHQGVCPVGWHIPSNAEWTALTDYVGGASTAGTKLKSSTGWPRYGDVPVGTNEYGWSALPGGYGVTDGRFRIADSSGCWWSATELNNFSVGAREIGYYNEQVVETKPFTSAEIKTYLLLSVRCVAD